eukprot:TRINITY_DN958_c1_g1_i1.p1 TRINITY_DN958_c1_g1~~TRINITY_DN958_c1_g1_i1.p1  ORF type:complete len:248 (-),score=47.10 TRINITY_DN958_c1_g1_i1:259-1002(-)
MVRKICVIDLGDPLTWNPVSFGKMFEELLRKEGDEWTILNILSGDPIPSPTDHEIFIITGSHLNVCDRASFTWFDSLSCLIQHAYETGMPKIYGGCFGCQMIAHSLGGVVDRNPSGRFILCLEKVRVVIEPSLQQPFWWSFSNGTVLRLIASHGYCVTKLPPNSILLGTSESCLHEIFLVGKYKNILAVQTHPEFDYQHAVLEIIVPIVRERMTPEELDKIQSQFHEFSRTDSNSLLNLVQVFFSGC